MTMLSFPAETVGADMLFNFFPLPDIAVNATATSSNFTLFYGPAEYDRFTGSGFKYDFAGYPYAGTIASWSYAFGGKTYMSATGINMPVATFMDYFFADNWIGFMEDAFSGNDKITGSKGEDDLYGFDGNDNIAGGNGYDIIYGGSGNDRISGQAAFDDLYGEDGNDTLDGGELDDHLFGGTGDDLLLGGASDDKLYGEADNDTLDGGAGADLMEGGFGDDKYIVNSGADIIVEEFDAGTDLVMSSVSLGLAENVENATLTGTASLAALGNDLDNRLTGNAAANLLDGGAGSDELLGLGGNDTLLGGGEEDFLDGGIGNDKMRGASGNDTYVLSAIGDNIDEEGHADPDDRVRSSITVNLLTLASGAIEHVELLGTAALNATGNAANNELVGNNGANVLNGDVGADFLYGGKGADTYVVDDAGDQVVEDFSGTTGGIDLVKSSITFDLSSLGNVEKVTLIGSDEIDAIGNGLGNTLTGNDTGNLLNGGLGKDTMIGGKGDDYYIVDNVGDVVTETITNAKGGGFDTVQSSVTYSLATRANVENLELTGVGDINGTGNAQGNQITGSLGNNKLDGAGGHDLISARDGNDTLLGGAGDDTLVGGIGADLHTGGTGRDTVYYASIAEAGDTVLDFKLGATGDILHIGDVLGEIGDPDDPFGGGFVSFTQVGKNTVVSIDADGTAGAGVAVTLVTLLNVTLTAANTANYVIEPNIS